MQKQNHHKSEKRKRLRYKEDEGAIKRKILQIQVDTELTLDEDFVMFVAALYRLFLVKKFFLAGKKCNPPPSVK